MFHALNVGAGAVPCSADVVHVEPRNLWDRRPLRGDHDITRSAATIDHSKPTLSGRVVSASRRGSREIRNGQLSRLQPSCWCPAGSSVSCSSFAQQLRDRCAPESLGVVHGGCVVARKPWLMTPSSSSPPLPLPSPCTSLRGALEAQLPHCARGLLFARPAFSSASFPLLHRPSTISPHWQLLSSLRITFHRRPE